MFSTGDSFQNRLALITGASAGIGAATAELLAALGCRVIITGRRQDRLESLKNQILSKLTNSSPSTELVTTLAFDVRDAQACESAFQRLGEKKNQIDILINNAGLAKGVELVQNAQPQDWAQMIDTNISGLLQITRLVLPAMVQRGTGDVVNLGSVAGRWTYQGGAVYCATKAAVRALTEGMRLDLAGTGIRVTNIAPGMVETEFSEVRLGNSQAAKDVYKDMTPLSPHDIAECIVWSLSRPRHINVQEMLVFPTDQAGVGVVHRRSTNRNTNRNN